MSNGNITTTSGLIGLQSQLDTVRTEIAATNVGLQNVASLIQTDSFLDQQRLLEEREQERLLAEREVRVGQEQELQKKVSAAVTEPVAKLEQKLTSTFDGITNSLRYLFTGFLGVGVLKGLKSAADLSIKTLSGIGGLIRNSFNAIGSGFSSLRGGIGSILNSITGITSKVSNGIISLATSPFKAISDIFKNFLPGIKPTSSGTESAGKGASSLFDGIGSIGRGALRLGGMGLGAYATYENINQGDIPGAALSALGTIPSPIAFPAALSSIGYELFTGGGIKTDKIFPEGMPSMPKIDLSSMGQSITNFFSLDAPAKEVKGNIEQGNTTMNMPSSDIKSTSISLPVVPFNPSVPPSQKPIVQPLPEPKPDIIFTTTGQQSQPTVVSGQTQTLTDVPLIPSSNPDNFYTLYAQVNYNVVI